MRKPLLSGGTLSAVTGLVLSSAVLAISGAAAQQWSLLVLLAVVLTTAQTWFQITDSGILAARRGQFLATRAIAFGVVKIVVLVAIVGAARAVSSPRTSSRSSRSSS